MINPLSQKRRRWLFRILTLLFFFIVPVFIFYATGYRIEIGKEQTNIVGVGGIYAVTDGDDITLRVDGELVEDMRIFRSAAYVQNVESGLHSVDTYGDGWQTWTKELMVRPHIVTRVESFNLPSVPQVRLVAAYKDTQNADVVWEDFASDFAFASTTNESIVLFASTTASTRLANPEYLYLSQRFASTTAERIEIRAQVEKLTERFTFGNEAATTTATTTKQLNDMYLREEAGEIFAGYIGDESKRPEYFCVMYESDEAVALQYGQHILDDLRRLYGEIEMSEEPQKLCRNEIRIDRKWQEVRYFDFVPGREGLVLMLLEDGLYVTEIDDRSWQNVQMLYPGRNLEVLIDGGRIFINDRDYILEVLMELS